MHEADLPNAAWLSDRSSSSATPRPSWACGSWRPRSWPGPGGWKTKKLRAVVIVAYAFILTLLAFDLVMALDPHWFSSLFGGYFFVSGMYAAVAAWTLRCWCRGRCPTRTAGTTSAS